MKAEPFEVFVKDVTAYRLGALGTAVQHLDVLISSGTLSPKTAEQFEAWACAMLKKMDDLVTSCISDNSLKAQRARAKDKK
jgi:hypothetical protein